MKQYLLRVLDSKTKVQRVMKKLIIFLFFFCGCISYAQYPQIDSLGYILKTAISDKEKRQVLVLLSIEYENHKPDSAIICLQEYLKLSKKIEDKTKAYKAKYYALSRMAYLFGAISHYPKALEYYIESLKLAEEMQSAEDIATANSNIAYIMVRDVNYPKALFYLHISDSIIDKNQLAHLKNASFGNLGNVYYKIDKLDSALYLTMRGYELASQAYDKSILANETEFEVLDNARFTGLWLNNLGNIYSKMGNISAAMKNYQEAQVYSNKASDADNICESSLGLAKLYEKIGSGDSAVLYAKRVLQLSDNNNYESRKLEAFEFLTGHYKSAGLLDSAFTYQEKMIAVKDSIMSHERIKQTLNLTLDEELRQHEKREILKKQQDQVNKTLQLLGVGMLIPSFFLFTIFLRRRKIKPQIIKFCGVVSLLMLFECITLILHPYVEEVSHHIVVIELLIFVCIAAVVIPTHHKIEHWLLSKLTEHKNAGQQYKEADRHFTKPDN